MINGEVIRLIDMIKQQDGTGSGLDADLLRQFSASQNPQANQIPVLNSSGQLPLPFSQVPILVNGQDMMYRTFYVDVINGSDSNDGSQTAPFKTIAKACSSVSVGGYGFIHLAGGQTFTINNDINLHNKRMVLRGQDSENPSIIQNEAYLNMDNKVETYGFKISNSQLCFYINITIQTANYPSEASGLEIWEGLIKRTDLTFGSVQFHNCTIQLGDTDLIRLAGGPSTLFVDFYTGSISRVGSNRDAYVIYNEVGNFGLRARGTDIGTLSWSDLLTGVVKDGNGVPRNVISNIVL